MTQSVLIIGGGIVGISSAIALAELGFKVTLLDKNPQLGTESSYAGAGILSPLRPWHYATDLHRIAARSLSLFPKWINTLQAHSHTNSEFYQSGMLYRLDDNEAQLATQWLQTDHAQYLGAHQRLNSEQVKPLNPWLAPLAHNEQWLWLPHVHQVRNPNLVATALDYARHLGITIHSGVHIQPNQPSQYADNQPVIDSTGTRWCADYYVWCGGAWTGLLAPNASTCTQSSLLADAVTQPLSDIKPIKGQILLYKQPIHWMPHIVMHNQCYIVPRLDGHILVGASLEDVGFDKTISIPIQTQLQTALASICPALAAQPIVKQWAGLRPFANTHNTPLVGRLHNSQHHWVNAGHYRYGLLLTPYSVEALVTSMTSHIKQL